jgi:hypothetical protein
MKEKKLYDMLRVQILIFHFHFRIHIFFSSKIIQFKNLWQNPENFLKSLPNWSVNAQKKLTVFTNMENRSINIASIISNAT